MLSTPPHSKKLPAVTHVLSFQTACGIKSRRCDFAWWLSTKKQLYTTLGFPISDPIRNTDHLQTDHFRPFKISTVFRFWMSDIWINLNCLIPVFIFFCISNSPTITSQFFLSFVTSYPALASDRVNPPMMKTINLGTFFRFGSAPLSLCQWPYRLLKWEQNGLKYYVMLIFQ